MNSILITVAGTRKISVGANYSERELHVLQGILEMLILSLKQGSKLWGYSSLKRWLLNKLGFFFTNGHDLVWDNSLKTRLPHWKNSIITHDGNRNSLHLPLLMEYNPLIFRKFAYLWSKPTPVGSLISYGALVINFKTRLIKKTKIVFFL